MLHTKYFSLQLLAFFILLTNSKFLVKIQLRELVQLWLPLQHHQYYSFISNRIYICIASDVECGAFKC